MTTNHKELCEKLRQASIQCSDCGMYETSSDFDLAVSMIESQASRIQQQALEYASLFDQCSEAQARIAEIDLEREQVVAEAQGYRDHAAKLQLELEATRQERNAAGVKARRELMPAYEARIAELEKGLKGLSSMYTFAWDVVDGGLFMSQDGKLRFEDAHKEARRVLGVELMEVDENGELTPEHEERTKLAARIAELEKERDALKADADGYRLIRAGRVYIEPQDIDGRVYVCTNEYGRYCKTTDEFDAEIAAALQAEKETRS